MKLKKIASLMLAGIMAVSMLAACGEGKDNTNPPASSTPVTSSTLVSDTENAIKKLNSTVAIDVDESVPLTDYITKANENGTMVSLTNDDVKEIVEDIFGTGDYGDAYDFYDVGVGGDLSESVNVGARAAGDDAVYYAVYTNGAVTADACRAQAVNEIAKCMENVKNDFTNANGAKLRNEYDMYVYEGSYVNASNQTIPYVLTVLISSTKAAA